MYTHTYITTLRKGKVLPIVFDDMAVNLYLHLVFTQPNLEKTPEHRVPPSEIFRVPKPGTVDWRHASDEHKQLVEETLARLRERADRRRVLLKPQFQDFDNHNNGHITRQQFRQVSQDVVVC